MDKGSNRAITAIGDADQESFIASSLTKLGFNVIHRATSCIGLSKFLLDHGDALLIASDDFRDINQIDVEDMVLIKGKSISRSSKASHNPKSELELSEILRDRKKPEASLTRLPTLCTSDVALFLSSGKARGTTTVAINFAHALVEIGRKVLFIDANFPHPDLAERFELNGIVRKSLMTRFGFTVCEISSIESLQEFALQSSEFDTVVIDLGQYQSKAINSLGRRIEELTFIWAIKSANTQFILTSQEEIEKTIPLHASSRALNPEIQSVLVLPLKSVLSTREREKLKSLVFQSTGFDNHLISKDSKSVEKMEGDRSTILESAPKSMLNSEIARMTSCLKSG